LPSHAEAEYWSGRRGPERLGHRRPGLSGTNPLVRKYRSLAHILAQIFQPQALLAVQHEGRAVTAAGTIAANRRRSTRVHGLARAAGSSGSPRRPGDRQWAHEEEGKMATRPYRRIWQHTLNLTSLSSLPPPPTANQPAGRRVSVSGT
jgi:hypothetical protein